MITVSRMGYKYFIQNAYDKAVKNLAVHAMQCSCRSAGNLILHGRYQRWIRYRGEKIPLWIQRVRCKVCGRTHALLPDGLVPYSQIPLEDQIDLILAYEAGEAFEEVLNRNPLLDVREAVHVIRKYLNHWKERLRSAGISLSMELTEACLRNYSRQFMQIRPGVNVYFQAAT